MTKFLYLWRIVNFTDTIENHFYQFSKEKFHHPKRILLYATQTVNIIPFAHHLAFLQRQMIKPIYLS